MHFVCSFDDKTVIAWEIRQPLVIAIYLAVCQIDENSKRKRELQKLTSFLGQLEQFLSEAL